MHVYVCCMCDVRASILARIFGTSIFHDTHSQSLCKYVRVLVQMSSQALFTCQSGLVLCQHQLFSGLTWSSTSSGCKDNQRAKGTCGCLD